MKLNLNLIDKGSEKLEKLKAERNSLTEDIYSAVDQTEKIYKDLDLNTIADDFKENAEKQLSKIDGSLSKYGEFEKTIADLSTGLTEGLGEYVLFAQASKNYQGFEKIISVFSKKNADRMRIQRLGNQSPKENLQQILDYAEQIFHEISSEREIALTAYDKLRDNGRVLTAKITEFGPKKEI